MASIRKLPSGKWNVRVSRQGYPLQAKSFINRTDADKWARTIEGEMDRGVVGKLLPIRSAWLPMPKVAYGRTARFD